MGNLKAEFMLHLISKVSIPSDAWGGDWETAQDLIIAKTSALADKLVAACTQASLPAPTLPAGPTELTERDQRVLECLVAIVPPGGRGALDSQWKAYVAHNGFGSRRAYESSRDRLLAAGRVRRAVNRYLPVRE